MEIRTNKELADAVNDAIKASGIKKVFIAEKLGIANQNLNRFLEKKNLSLDEANKILNLLGYNATISIKKD